MAFEPDQNDRRAEVKRLFRQLQRVRTAKEAVEHAQAVDLCRQAAKTFEPGKGQTMPPTFKNTPSETPSKPSVAPRRTPGVRVYPAKTRKRQQGRSLGHGMGS